MHPPRSPYPTPPTNPSLLQLLCECLLYACVIKQRQRTADIIDILGVLHSLSLRARSAGAGGDSLAAQQQAYCVLAAALCCLLPLENAEGKGGPHPWEACMLCNAPVLLFDCCNALVPSSCGSRFVRLLNRQPGKHCTLSFALCADREADERLLRELAASRELDSKVASFPVEDSYMAVVRLAWGCLLSEFGDESAAGSSQCTADPLFTSGAMPRPRAAHMPCLAALRICRPSCSSPARSHRQ